MFNNLNGIFQFYQTQIAQLSGQTFTVYRPPLGIVTDQTPAVFNASLLLKAEIAGTRFAQGRIPNVEYYALFGDRNQFKPGDILITNDHCSTTPPLQVIEYSPMEEAMALRASRTADIVYSAPGGIEVPIYQNIRFEWMPNVQAANNLGSMLGGSRDLQNQHAYIYTLPGLRTDSAMDAAGEMYDIAGLRLIETTGTVRARWFIKEAVSIGNNTQLVLEQEQS